MPKRKTARMRASHAAMMGRARKGSIKARDASRRNGMAPARIIQRGRPSLCPECNRPMLRFVDRKECPNCGRKLPLSFRTRDHKRKLAKGLPDILICEA